MFVVDEQAEDVLLTSSDLPRFPEETPMWSRERSQPRKKRKKPVLEP